MFSKLVETKSGGRQSSLSLPLYQQANSGGGLSSASSSSWNPFRSVGGSKWSSGSPPAAGGGGGEDASSSQEAQSVLNGWFSQADSDPCFPKGLTKKQRIIGFFICLLLGSLFISLSMVMLPMIVLKARKFTVLYSFGSLCLLASFSMLWGPMAHLRHLLSGPRLLFSAAYLGSLFATLYAALALHSALLSLLFAIVQIVALVWYILSYIPGGQTGLKFFAKLFYAAASKTVSTLPV